MTSGEPALADWTIRAYAADGSLADSDVTAADGSYELTLDPGSYTICEVAQTTGPSPSRDEDCADLEIAGLGDAGHAVTVTSSSATTAKDFGNWTTGTVSGTKFEDLDADGAARESGEPALADWTIRAYAADGSLADSDATAADGSYELTLDPGSYTICEVAQTNWTQSFPSGEDCADLEIAGLGDAGHAVTVTSSSATTAKDFGNWTTGTVSGTKFEDLDADGAARESGEPALADWTIRAYAADGSLADSDATAADGSYELTLDPGSYTICEVAQTNWTQSFPSGEDCADLEIAGLGDAGHAVTVTSSSATTAKDFGNWTTGTVSGTKFEDLDADGAARETGEPALADWTIRAYAADGSRADSDATAADGSYELTLDPGSYTICEAARPTGPSPSRAVRTAPTSRSRASAMPAMPSPSPAPAPRPPSDFGNWTEATITGVKFQDHNANGTRNSIDGGFNGWTIKVFEDLNGDGDLDAGEPERDSDVTTTVAGTDGSFELEVAPGKKYVVCEQIDDQPGNFQSAPDNLNCDGLATGLADGGHAIASVTSGQAIGGLEFGNFRQRTTSTSLSCTPIPAAVNTTVTCTALVTDTDTAGFESSPEGTVTFTGTASTCELVPVPSTTHQSKCSVTFNSPTPDVIGVIAMYQGSELHLQSQSDRVPIVFYDPSAGFVTGGGYILHQPTMTPAALPIGKNNFGFVSKYNPKDPTRPVGETEFQCKVCNINFHSTSYDWLVVTTVPGGKKAQFQGSGTINGGGDYGFLVTVIDLGKDDKFRIKIWNKTTGAIVYDNEPGVPDNLGPTTPSVGGNIVIHK